MTKRGQVNICHRGRSRGITPSSSFRASWPDKDELSTAEIKKRIFAEVGQLGGADKATERVVFSLRDWGILAPGEQRYSYAPLHQRLRASHRIIEQWALAAALAAHPAEEVPFTDLVRLPELFPFQFAIGVDELRRSPHFEVHLQGAG